MVREREGFTLVELLMVIVVLGILTAMVMAKFGQTREASYYSTLRADLNNLRNAQEVYFQTTGTFRYASSTAMLDFLPSSGVTFPVLNTLNNGQAWEAVANHSGLNGGVCVIGFGELGTESWGASGGTPAVAVTEQNAGAPVCND